MNNNNNLKEFFKKNGFSLAICSTVAILLVATLYFSYKGFEGYEDNNIAQEDINEISKDNFEAVNKTDVKSYKESTTSVEITTEKKQSENVTEKITEQTTNKIAQDLKEKNTETTTSNKKAQQEEKQKEENKKDTKKEEAKVFNKFDESQEMTWPVSGQIVMDYSTETAIYDKTLDQYRTNNSISISAPVGTDVVASAEGIVENIFTDAENGKTIVINHGNGWLSTYGQLEEEVNVAVGDIVKEGQVVAKIGEPTNYSVLLGSHLNFKITKNDISSDPKLVLAQLEE